MELDDDEILYGTDAPGRNVPELAIATLALIKKLQEPPEEKEALEPYLLNHLDTYVKENPLPPVSFEDISLEWFNVSKPLSIEKDLNSHVVVLDFFTYCCINCLHILPDLKALEEKYPPNNSPVLVVGIHSAKFENERVSKCVADAVKKNDIAHPVANDVDCKLWHHLGISCWPTLLIMGPGGAPLFVLMGEGNRDLLFQFVEASVKYFRTKTDAVLDPLPLAPQLHVPSLESDLYYPGKVGRGPKGLIIADSGNNRIVLTDTDGEVEAVIGSGVAGFEDGPWGTASFRRPQGVAFHPGGLVYVADTENHAIRVIHLKSGCVETVAGTGLQGGDAEGGLRGTEQALSSPWDVCLGRSCDVTEGSPPNLLFIAMAGLHQIWALFLTDGQWLKNSFYPEGTVVRLAGSGAEENRNTSYPLKAGFAQPSGIALSGTTAFVADSESSAIRQFSLTDGAVRKGAGGGIDPTDLFSYGDQDGAANVARFQHPLGVASVGEDVYVADTYNHKIKVLRKRGKTYVAETLFGDGAPGDETLNEPGGLCPSENGKFLYVADTNNFCIKEFDIEEKKIRQVNLKFPTTTTTPPSEDKLDSKECLRVFVPRHRIKVHLKVQLHLPTHVHLTPEAKHRYSLVCSENVFAEASQGRMESETELPVQVDLSTIETGEANILATLFLCFDEGKCVMHKVSTRVEFLRTEEKGLKDKLDVDVKLKINL